MLVYNFWFHIIIYTMASHLQNWTETFSKVSFPELSQEILLRGYNLHIIWRSIKWIMSQCDWENVSPTVLAQFSNFFIVYCMSLVDDWIFLDMWYTYWLVLWTAYCICFTYTIKKAIKHIKYFKSFI